MSERIDRSERGFTLIEVTITALILMIVMGGLLGLLDSQTKSEHDVQTIVASQEDVRMAMTTVARDVRAGTLQAVPTATQLDLNVYGSGGASPTHVRWRLDTSTMKLLREVVPASGPATLTYSVGPLDTTSLFRALTPKNNPPLPGQELTCTSHIGLSLQAATVAAASFSEGSDIAMRNTSVNATLCN